MGGGSTTNEGYVEALGSNGIWGGVCDDNWDIEDANVVCRMLGFDAAASFSHAFPDPPGGEHFVLDDLHCTGSESSIFDCPHNGEWNENCGASEHAGVRCTDGKPTFICANIGLMTRFRM